MQPTHSQRVYIPALDGFRAYAILVVVTVHILQLSAADGGGGLSFLAWATFGGQLEVFFLVSGCGLFLPMVARGGLGSLREYALKRGARILPAYWLVLTLTLILVAATGQPVPFPDPGEIVIQYSFLQWPAVLVDTSIPVGFGNAPLWMVSVVVGLYVLLPLVAAWYLRHPLLGLALAAGITLGWKLVTPHLIGGFEAIERADADSELLRLIVSIQVPGWIYCFALGMTCAWAYVQVAMPRPREQLQRLALFAAPLALAAACLSNYWFASVAERTGDSSGAAAARSDALLSFALTTSKAAVIGVIVLGPVLLSKPFDNPAARVLAELSYGLYLIHFVVATYIGSMLLDLPADGTAAAGALWFVVVIPPSLALAYLSSRFVEKPAQAWARARGRRPVRKGSPQGSAPDAQGAAARS